jgi:hypothetical protein
MAVGTTSLGSFMSAMTAAASVRGSHVASIM